MSAGTAERSMRTSLYDRHVALGARMVEFGGYDMPMQYSGMRNEHEAVRTRAGIFDLSHMGEVRISGPDAGDFVQRLVTNDVSRLSLGQALYTPMCNEQGGIVDDLLAYRDYESYLLVVNASTRPKDVEWIRRHMRGDVQVTDESDTTALIAVQGPRALAVVGVLSDGNVAELRPFHFMRGEVAGAPALISRTGYTGEDGFELFIDAESAGTLWDALIRAGKPCGMIPVGLGARDTLRLEAGLRLYGQDMDESVDPLMAGIGWTVKFTAGDFVGRGALVAIRDTGLRRTFVGLCLPERAIARHEHAVLHNGVVVGHVTSGTFSFTLGCPVATAYVDAGAAAGPLDVDIRGTVVRAEIMTLPFYRRS